MLRKVLIVDDTNAWLIFHQELIHQLYGNIFEITTASSAAEALEIIRKNTSCPFCTIITDLQMEMDYYPELAGEWLIQNIKNIKAYENTNIVIISSMSNIEYIAKKYNVECISKSLLIYNKLLMKFMFEKLMPFLTKL